MIVCHCRAVNDAAVREAIAAGARDALEVAVLSGAGTDCCGCAPVIAELLAECGTCPLRPAAARQTAAVA